MRLGCEATAVDINPVAWFILKCTLEYPQKLAGQKRPLPAFILKNETFMKEFLTKAKGCGKAEAGKPAQFVEQPVSNAASKAPISCRPSKRCQEDYSLT
jgi:hypothetical protein